jgi:predicted RNA-binding protein with PIN domain
MNIIIDGYNMIRQIPSLQQEENRSLESGRTALVELVGSYRETRGFPVTVVFDGKSGLSESDFREVSAGVEIIYSGRGRTADDVIKRIIGNLGESVVLVSADRELVNLAISCGAGTISPSGFMRKIEAALSGEPSFHQAPAKGRGSSHRLKKKIRRSVGKTFKL